MKNMIRISYGSLLLIFFAACSSTKTTTFVLLPDTQYYAEKYPEILHAQTDWIKENVDQFDMVLQQGDLTQNNSPEEWEVVQAAFYKLNNEIPYVLALGNHDMGSEPGKFADVRNTDHYNTYFPVQKMSELPAFGGTFEPNKMDNVYYLFDDGNTKWLVLSIEFGPRDKVLEWADRVADQYSDRIVILNTHSYMYSDSTRQGGVDSWRPQAYGVGKDLGPDQVNDGEQIWNKLVKPNDNIRFVFSGHILNSGVGTLVSINEAGYPVYQFLANYQSGVKGSEKGGNGYLRIFKVNHKENTIDIKTYSPFIDEYHQDEAHNFVIRSVSLENESP